MRRRANNNTVITKKMLPTTVTQKESLIKRFSQQDFSFKMLQRLTLRKFQWN